jgi:hypothetical protein
VNLFPSFKSTGGSGVGIEVISPKPMLLFAQRVFAVLDVFAVGFSLSVSEVRLSKWVVGLRVVSDKLP